MRKKLLALFLISSIMSVTVMAEDTNTDAGETETRIVTVNSETLESISDTTETADTNDTLDTETDLTEETIMQITETKYVDDYGFSLWYNAESLKISEYGGQLCFMPTEEENSLESPAVLIITPNEPGETPSPIHEVTAMYPAESVSTIEETAYESGITIQSAEVNDEGQHFAFYIVSYEDMSLNITSMILDEEAETYSKEFHRLVETIIF